MSRKFRQCQKRSSRSNSSKVFWNRLKPRKRSDILTSLAWTLRDKLGRSFDPKRPEDVAERFSTGFKRGVTVKVGTWVMEVSKILPDPKGKDKALLIILIRVQGGVPHQYRCPVARLSMKSARQTERQVERETDELIRSLVTR